MPDQDDRTPQEVANRELFKIHRFTRRISWTLELRGCHEEAERLAAEAVTEGIAEPPLLAALQDRVAFLQRRLWVDGQDEWRNIAPSD